MNRKQALLIADGQTQTDSHTVRRAWQYLIDNCEVEKLGDFYAKTAKMMILNEWCHAKDRPPQPRGAPKLPKAAPPKKSRVVSYMQPFDMYAKQVEGTSSEYVAVVRR